MPRKHTVKQFSPNTYYHLYNRALDKNRIFEDNQDYKTFLYYLEIYLSPLDTVRNKYKNLRSHFLNHNLNGEIDLVAFCLLPNHFHLLIKQTTTDAITRFMRQLITSYSMYFNKRYNRNGPLFQSIYKAARIEKDEDILEISRFIHQKPAERGASLSDFQWSSYKLYLEPDNIEWLKTENILGYFHTSNPQESYRQYIEHNKPNFESIPHLLIDY